MLTVLVNGTLVNNETTSNDTGRKNRFTITLLATKLIASLVH